MTKDTHHNALQHDHVLFWYRIKQVLGQGAFGITYLAYDINLDRLVAVKEYMPGNLAVRVPDMTIQPLSSEHQDDFVYGLNRFISEARTLTKFEHPNLVRVFNAFEGNNTAYMVMNYEVGESLHTVIKRKLMFTGDELLKIMLPLLDGLQHMHAQNFVHRDIKPGNIFIRKSDGSPVLLDFGSARQTRQETAQTLTNLVSPGYAPIEQYTSNSDKQGPWTDIYGLGATIYKIITGNAPVNAVDRGSAIMHDGKDCHVPLSQLDMTGYSPSFLAAIDHALAFKAEHRPQTVIDWKMELTGVSEPGAGKPVSANDDDGLINLHPETPAVNEGSDEETRDAGTEQLFRVSADRHDAKEPVKLSRLSRISKYKTGLYIAAALTVMITLVVAGIAMFNNNGGSTESSTAKLPAATVQADKITAPDSAPDQKITQITAQTDASSGQIQIEQLLAEAQNSVKQLRLTSPAGNNAYEQYRQVLALDPENAQARAGLRQISDKYIALAYTAIQANHTGKARSYIQKAQEIVPDSEKIKPAQNALQAKLAELAKQNETAAAKTTTEATTEQEKSGESTGFLGGMKKWLKDNAGETDKQEQAGDQFTKSIGGGQ